MTVHRRRWRAALALLGSSALSACVVTPYGTYPYYGYYGYGYYGYPAGTYSAAGEGIVTNVAPPTPYYETVPVAPFVGAVWFGGYWNWYGGRYVWAPGYWGYPRAGYAWHPYRWAPYGGRWAMSGGWARVR